MKSVFSGIMGLVVADALGVPVEFQDREVLRQKPVENMRSFGTYNQPAGTWSDDSSMTLALLDSLKDGLDYKDIMDKILAWYEEEAYTPHGQMFDIGIGTTNALRRYKSGTRPLQAGGSSEHDNGNGSLMRVLPILFYLQSKFGSGFLDEEEAFEFIHNISALTHAHRRSKIACGIYISIGHHLTRNKNLDQAIEKGIEKAFAFYRDHEEFKDELNCFSRLEDNNFKEIGEDEINSGGYVVDCLEASTWCLLNTNSYKAAVLKAVNLGSDTDTTGAVTGGLAGLFYGYESIPKDWLDVIAKKDWIEELCMDFGTKIFK